jgi:hypothetical protein
MTNACLFELALRRRTAEITAYRFEIQSERMPMSRLSEKLKQAGGVASRLHAKAEARADEVIAREPIITERIEDVFAGHFQHLEDAEKALDALERDLALMGNEPTQSSGGSSEGDTKPITTERVALGPHPDQPSQLHIDAAAAGFDPHVYRAFEAGLPLEAAKAANGS